jgi:hypothetical protein
VTEAPGRYFVKLHTHDVTHLLLQVTALLLLVNVSGSSGHSGLLHFGSPRYNILVETMC